MLSVNRASAGSGKTFTLAREYIKYILGELDRKTGRYKLVRAPQGRHRSILAVTFTNKATEEMKCRIIHELAILAKMEKGWEDRDGDHLDYLTSELNCTRDDLQRAAAAALSDLLLEFSKFQISTIDSFFQGVLRTFAREAELSGNYDVSLERKDMLALAVDKLLASLRDSHTSTAERQQLISWLEQLMLNEMEDGNNFNIFNRSTSLFGKVVSFIDNITDETFMLNQEAITLYLDEPEKLTNFATEVKSHAKSLRNAAQNAAQAVAATLKAYALDPKTTLEYHTSGVVQKWTTGDGPSSYASTEVKMANTPEACLKDITISDEARHDLLTAIEATGSAAIEAVDYGTLAKQVARNLYMMGLVKRTFDFLSVMLQESNTLLLSDTNTILSGIIGDEATPFVYERIGTTLRHFLIDEFQDTSKMQWNNMLPLLTQGLGDGHESLIIGDEKQCIYRFRNSDPTLLQSRVQRDLAPFISNPDDPAPQNSNWRSSPVVVNFNNELFAKLAAECGFSNIYANVRQLTPKKNDKVEGYVKINYFDGKQPEGNPNPALVNMMDEITRQLNAGYAPSDIAVLVRWKKEGSDVINFILDAHNDPNHSWPGLRVVSDDSMLVSAAPSVRLVISYLQSIAAENLDKPVNKKLSKRHAAMLLQQFEENVSQGKSHTDSLLEAIKVIEAERKALDDDPEPTEIPRRPANTPTKCLNLTSIVDRIITDCVSPKTRTTENVFLTALVDMVTDFSRTNNNDLREFLRWWETVGVKSQVVLPPDKDAIRVMTIHKSKGLEFKCVHLPFASWPMYKPKSPEWFDISAIDGATPVNVPPFFPLRPSSWMEKTFLAPQFDKMRKDGELDELNVAYVAFTRAIQELIVGMADPAPAQKGLSSTLAELIAKALGISKGGEFVAGSPSKPNVESQKPFKTLEPTVTMPVASYETLGRNDLWDKTIIERSEAKPTSSERGILQHFILSQIRRYDDIDRTFTHLAVNGVMTQENARKSAQNFKEMIDRLNIRRWFDGYKRVICETTVTDDAGTRRRPDRVVWTADGNVEIVDYKTGQDYTSKYAPAIREYMKRMRDLGFKNVKGFLFYLDLKKVVEIS